SAVTYVAICVVSAIVNKKHIKNTVAQVMTIMPMLRVGMPFVTLRVTQRFCGVRGICLRLKAPFRPSASDFEGSK
ncbi:hypothetical protein, partial [Pseudomonas cannabina]|uniref:hypothetical protein n=1 Tax=Pseudomonas cannabina TaxID=86840 RepID=UPI000EFE3B4D